MIGVSIPAHAIQNTTKKFSKNGKWSSLIVELLVLEI